MVFPLVLVVLVARFFTQPESLQNQFYNRLTWALCMSSHLNVSLSLQLKSLKFSKGILGFKFFQFYFLSFVSVYSFLFYVKFLLNRVSELKSFYLNFCLFSFFSV